MYAWGSSAARATREGNAFLRPGNAFLVCPFPAPCTRRARRCTRRRRRRAMSRSRVPAGRGRGQATRASVAMVTLALVLMVSRNGCRGRSAPLPSEDPSWSRRSPARSPPPGPALKPHDRREGAERHDDAHRYHADGCRHPFDIANGRLEEHLLHGDQHDQDPDHEHERGAHLRHALGEPPHFDE